jgi:hypothetical protein
MTRSPFLTDVTLLNQVIKITGRRAQLGGHASPVRHSVDDRMIGAKSRLAPVASFCCKFAPATLPFCDDARALLPPLAIHGFHIPPP